MKISTLQENLKYGLSLTGHLAGKNINLPILNNILIEAKDNKIKLISTNLEIGITCLIRGKIEKEGITTVNSKIISDYINLLANKKVELNNKNKKLLIKSDNYKTIINSEEAEDFPLIPQINKQTFFKCEIEKFKNALNQTIFAVANNETRLELSGVLFIFDKNNLTMVATDSYRLAEKKINIKSNTDKENKIIIPVKTLQEISRILTNIKEEINDSDNNEIEFFISDNQILFNIGSVELISRIIEGQYPDYKQIIPKKFKTKIIVNKTEFTRAIKAASIFSKTGVNDINLDFSLEKNTTIISSSSSQSGENTTQLESKIQGSDNGIVVNYRYLLEGVNNINSENIIIEVVDNNTPCIIKPEKDKFYLYIVMPIKQ